MMRDIRANRIPSRCAVLRLAVLWSLSAAAGSAGAQETSPTPDLTPPPPGSLPAETFDEKLIRMLQKHNAISREDAEELLRSARQDEHRETPAAPGAAPPPPLSPQPGDVHVHRIPEAERKKIEEEVTSTVLAREREENYGRPGAYPEWLNRVSFFGDFRFREQYDYYQRTNAPFINFQALNSGAPFDVSAGNIALPPTVNDTIDRQQSRFRLRFGLNGIVNDNLTATFRFASGTTTNPVSNNQTLGSDFNKYSFVIDQAYIDLHADGLNGWLGRMPKPFVSTSLVYWDDLSLDGIGARYRYDWTETVRPFVTLGAFAVENTSLDYPTNQIAKIPSRDKWLYAAQLGVDLKFADRVKSTTAAALYEWHNLQGVSSLPCLASTTAIACSSDNSRPGFLQKGNTLFALRDLLTDPNNPNGPQYQYFGLASKFEVFNAITTWDFALDSSTHVVLTADFAKNLAFHSARIASLQPVNNSGANGSWQGGNKAYQVQLLVGTPVITRPWQWSMLGGYKRVESDAVVDAFDDPDFFQTQGVGGTNDKGYFVFGSLGLLKNTWTSARWFSAQEISGPPLRVNTLQLDLNASF